MSSMATLVANRSNLSGSPRTETLNGREYLVCSATLIVPGVLNGSSGPLLYPADEVARSADDWNNIPITVGHPTRNGRPVSARSAGVEVVGFVNRSRYDGALKAEAWFAADALRRLSPKVLANLRAGLRAELSTGLFTTDFLARPGSSYNGRSYHAVARRYVPDHLAVLPDGTAGACSVADGCGLNVNSNRRTAMRPAHDDFLHCPCTGCTNERGGAPPYPLVLNCDRDRRAAADDYKPKPMDLPAINWAEAKRELDAQQKVRRD